jgi:low temperature requirement protein LtrA
MRFILWGIALSIDLITPWFTLKDQSRLPRFSTSKLPERFGLLMIIVLGETAAGVVNGIQNIHSIDSEKIFTAMSGVILGFSLWWIYFDFIARRVAKPQILYSILWSYLHLPLAMGIAAIGAGLTNLISLTGETLPPNIQTLTMASYGLTLLMMGLLEITLSRTEDEPAHHLTSPILKIITGITAIGLILLLPPLHSMSLILILIVLTLIQMVYGLWVWFGQK